MSFTLPLRRNPAHAKTGPAAYARAALRWKFTPSSELTGFFSEVKDDGTRVVKRFEDKRKHHPTQGGGSTDPPTTGGSTGGGSGTEVPADSLENDLEYVVDVKIGTPGVTLQLDFDTGSSDLWVWSSEYKGSTSGHTVYNPKNSSTAKAASGETWNISYGDGSSASGNVYNDTVTIGSVAIPGQAVELAEKLSSSFLSSGSDGLLGLAWPAINTVSPNPVATPVENMINQNLIPKGLFTVKLDRGDNNGFYSFGEIDTSVTTDTIEYTPVDNSQGFWMFNSTTYTINGQSHTQSGNTAIADTGTTLCLVSDAVVSAIYSQIQGAKMDNSQGGYVYPVNAKVPTVQFAVGSKLITINPDNFAYGPASNGTLFGGIQSRGSNPFDILGDVFLKNCYVVFDQANTQLGVAQRTD